MLRFLADESCDFAVVRALRAEGFDVLAVAEISPGAEDKAVIEYTVREGRLLLTEDEDFGQPACFVIPLPHVPHRVYP